MMKSGLVILVIGIMVSTPLAYGHPDFVSVQINDENGKMNVKVIGLENKSDDKDEVEFLSDKWIYRNFMLLLSLFIGGVMSIVISLVYREEITKTITKVKIKPKQFTNKPRLKWKSKKKQNQTISVPSE